MNKLIDLVEFGLNIIFISKLIRSYLIEFTALNIAVSVRRVVIPIPT